MDILIHNSLCTSWLFLPVTCREVEWLIQRMESFTTFGMDFPEKLSANTSLQQWACLTLWLTEQQQAGWFPSAGHLCSVLQSTDVAPTILQGWPPLPTQTGVWSSKRPRCAEIQSKEENVLAREAISQGLPSLSASHAQTAVGSILFPSVPLVGVPFPGCDLSLTVDPVYSLSFRMSGSASLLRGPSSFDWQAISF